MSGRTECSIEDGRVIMVGDGGGNLVSIDLWLAWVIYILLQSLGYAWPIWRM